MAPVVVDLRQHEVHRKGPGGIYERQAIAGVIDANPLVKLGVAGGRASTKVKRRDRVMVSVRWLDRYPSVSSFSTRTCRAVQLLLVTSALA